MTEIIDDPAPADRLGDLARIAAGDEAAICELLETLVTDRVLQPAIRRYLFNEDDVAMVEQQTLVVVAFKLDRWSGRGAFSPWVRQVAANEAKTLIRSRDRSGRRSVHCRVTSGHRRAASSSPTRVRVPRHKRHSWHRRGNSEDESPSRPPGLGRRTDCDRRKRSGLTSLGQPLLPPSAQGIASATP